MSLPSLPEVTRIYQNTFFDSTRWDGFKPRDGDIIISTSYKGGTTWTQAICGALIFQSPDPPAPLDELSPWIDSMYHPIEDVLDRVETMTYRRYVKTHLPLTAVPYYDNVHYIFVGRDGRDVWMSLWNHFRNMKPEVVQALNDNPLRKGPEVPPVATNINEGFDEWMSKSLYPWERDGYPAWSLHNHAQTWWNYRHLDNILCVHFADMLDDLNGQMRRIAAYLDIPVNEDVWPALVQSVTFDEMKRNFATRAPGSSRGVWKDTKNFFHKGTNRRWEGVLSADQIRRYESLITELMEPNLVRWLVHDDGFIDPKSL